MFPKKEEWTEEVITSKLLPAYTIRDIFTYILFDSESVHSK